MMISEAISANGHSAVSMCFLSTQDDHWELDVVVVPYTGADMDSWHPPGRFGTAIEAFEAAKAWLSARR
jgi:hypothetical protein